MSPPFTATKMSRQTLSIALIAVCAIVLMCGSVWVVLQDPVNTRVFVAAIAGVLASALYLIGAAIAVVVSVWERRKERPTTVSATISGRP